MLTGFYREIRKKKKKDFSDKANELIFTYKGYAAYVD